MAVLCRGRRPKPSRRRLGHQVPTSHVGTFTMLAAIPAARADRYSPRASAAAISGWSRLRRRTRYSACVPRWDEETLSDNVSSLYWFLPEGLPGPARPAASRLGRLRAPALADNLRQANSRFRFVQFKPCHGKMYSLTPVPRPIQSFKWALERRNCLTALIQSPCWVPLLWSSFIEM